MSPIKGLTENRRLIRLGKIHLGVKVKNKNGVEYPKATDYFVCPPEVQDVYGECPDRLDIIIPVEDDEMWCSQYYRQYSRTRGLVCKGDGETCRRMIDRNTGAVANRDSKDVVWKDGLPCPGIACPDYQAKKCQEVMNLQFLLPRVPGVGVWQIDTGSINSIRNINDNASMLRAVCGRVSWIPLTLTLEPKEVVNPDDGKKKVVRCLNLRQDKGFRELLAAAEKEKINLLIPPPVEDQEPLDEVSRDTAGDAAGDTAGDEEIVDIETGEIISQDEELFGEGEEAGAVPEARNGEKTTRGERQQPDGAVPVKPTRDPETIKTINDLMKACFQDYQMQPKAVLKELGYSSQADINEKPSMCYQKIAVTRS